MGNDPGRYRQVHVVIDITSRGRYVHVFTRVASNAQRREMTLFRAAVPDDSDVSTVRGIVQLALTALRVAADRL